MESVCSQTMPSGHQPSFLISFPSFFCGYLKFNVLPSFSVHACLCVFVYEFIPHHSSHHNHSQTHQRVICLAINCVKINQGLPFCWNS